MMSKNESKIRIIIINVRIKMIIKGYGCVDGGTNV